MIRVQTVDGGWYTARYEDTILERLRQGSPIDVIPSAAAFKREWVNPAHVVRVVEQESP